MASAWHLYVIILYNNLFKILKQILHVNLESDVWVRFSEQMPLVRTFKTNAIIANATRTNASRSKDSSQRMKLKNLKKKTENFVTFFNSSSLLQPIK